GQEIVALMGCLSPEDWDLAQKYDIIPLVGSFQDLDMAGARIAKPQKICIKCDTGMSRLGFSPYEGGLLLDALRGSDNLRPVLFASHFACADNPEESGYTAYQRGIFNNFYKSVKEVFPEIRSSLGNSAASLSRAEAGNEIFRPGLILYGGNPFHNTTSAGLGAELEWAMSVTAPVTATRALEKGQSVSYGCSFTARRPMRIAIVGCGYSQGYSRKLSNKARVVLNGRRTRQLGKICMGMFMIDISDQPEVKPGDAVWIAGGECDNGVKPVDLQELADMAGTIPYELMCVFGSMNPRIYEDR
ncbi:MAG: alanine racemase, partial [Desulfovibrio sp.]|nr:alanine racemase [Desulfovibrio sp.]